MKPAVALAVLVAALILLVLFAARPVEQRPARVTPITAGPAVVVAP